MNIPPLGIVKSLLLVSMVTFIVSGCGSLGNSAAWPPPYSLPAGSSLSINQDLVVSPNTVSVWIQFGKVIKPRDVDLDSPNCHFELYTIKPVAQTIYKDIVEIRRFVNSDEYVSNVKLMYASLRVDADDGGGPMARIFHTVIYLKSSKQSDLYRLTCEVWDNPYNGVYLTMDQIQQTLGDIATFRISR